MKINQYPYEKQLDKVHEWIQSADQKISVALAVVNGVTLAFVIPVSKILVDHSLYLLNHIFTITLIEVISFIAISEFCLIFALFPRLKIGSSMKSLLYFGSLSQMSASELRRKVEQTTQDELVNDYLDQLTISSQISTIKHRQLKNAIQAFVVSLIFMFIFLITFIVLSQ